MTIVIHDEMDKIRLHAEHNCRKIYTPESPFSPEIQAWYDRIHAYLALIKLLENSTNRNLENTFRFARRKGIDNLESLLLKEIKAGLQFCRLCQMEERKKGSPIKIESSVRIFKDSNASEQKEEGCTHETDH